MERIVVGLWRATGTTAAACRGALLADWFPEVAAQVRAGEVEVLVQCPDQGPHTHAPDDVGNVPNADALIVIDPTGRGGSEVRRGEVRRGEVRLRAGVPRWAGVPGWAEVPGLACLTALSRRVEVWRVHSCVRKAPSAPAALTMVSFVTRRGDLDHDEFVAHWTERHTPLALRHHVGLSGYTQHVVDESLTPGGTSIDGIAELAFADVADYEQHYYDSDAGKQVIRDDVARFIELVPVRLTTLMEPPDLAGVDLAGVDLAGVDRAGVDRAGADLAPDRRDAR